MHKLIGLGIGLLLACSQPAAAGAPNPKRGLVFIDSPDAGVNSVWVQPGSPLTWYYNYKSELPDAYKAIPETDFEFVPMMWGAGEETNKTTHFLSNITALLNKGHKIKHALGFNEPDVDWSGGGSNMTPRDAAQIWINNFMPLQAMGIKIGLPCMQAQRDPTNWTMPFLANCTELLQKDPKSKVKTCGFDFATIHSFGNISELTGRVGRYNEVFPGLPIWVTEYALNDSDLNSTQAFFNESLAYLDATAQIERYTYFGAFRSDVSNVGPNVAMLDPYNRLTDIGAWYLDQKPTGFVPVYGGDGGGGGSSNGTSGTCTSANPCGKANGAIRDTGARALGWLAVVCVLSLLL